jgi:hypothetical protein
MRTRLGRGIWFSRRVWLSRCERLCRPDRSVSRVGLDHLGRFVRGWGTLVDWLLRL